MAHDIRDRAKKNRFCGLVVNERCWIACLVWLLELGLVSSYLLFFCNVGLALAHPRYGEYISSDPVANSQLKRAPQTITIHFSEYINVKKSKLVITDVAGKLVSIATLQPMPIHVQMLQANMKDTGSEVYIVNWYTVSALDGGRDGGSFRFFVHVSTPMQRLLNAHPSSLPAHHLAAPSTSGISELATIPLWLAGCIGLAGLFTGIAVLWIFYRQADYRRAIEEQL